MKRANLIAKGKVQKVGYRDFVQDSVENLEDENVKVVCEGEEPKIEDFIRGIKVKKDFIEVVETSAPTGKFKVFKIYDIDGFMVEYNWDFGDGVTGTGITYNHTYIANGTYNMKLTVTDNDYLIDSTTWNVTISNVRAYDVCDFVNDIGLENLTLAHVLFLTDLFIGLNSSLDQIPTEHRPNGIIKNPTEDDVSALTEYYLGNIARGNKYAKKSRRRECIAVSEKPVHLNNFINNTNNVDSIASYSIWNSTSKITYTYNGNTYTNYLGNYWDDYKEKYPGAEESDECPIWDTPYSIDSDQDNHPLIEPFENYSIYPVFSPEKVEINTKVDVEESGEYAQDKLH